MSKPDTWNWDSGERQIADLDKLGQDGAEVTELAFSPDGERCAAALEGEPDHLTVHVNDAPWEGEFEKAWQLRFSPDGRLTALVRVDDEWTLGVDGALWEGRFEFAWNPRFSEDGAHIALQIKREMEYSVAIDDQPWEQNFLSIRDYALSPDGTRVAAVAQLEELPEADVFKFFEGTWGVVVDGQAWERRFLNAYAPTFSADGARVAVEVRTDICDYTLAQDQALWGTSFGGVWEPRFRPTGGLLAPVRKQGSWTLAEDGKELWSGRYLQLWQVAVSADGKRVAAVVAPSYGRWTIAVDDQVWPTTFGDMVLPPRFSADGRRVAALVKDEGRWTVAVDGQPWPEGYAMAWDPVFSPDGATVMAKVEVDGGYTFAVDGRAWGQRFDKLWDPVFNPSGHKVLVRGVSGGKAVRKVVPLAELAR